ncbi:hypothetical protein FBQ99_18530 [Chloroflexi bacterium CFX2]|nr:hypothetical protein [Chloroflexi bacterium CFX2]
MTKFLITALIAGALMGLAFAGTDLFNPRTSAAEANRMNIDAQHQQAMYLLDEQLAAAKTEAEIKEIQRQQALLDAQYQHDIQALSQDLAHQDLAFRTWMMVLTILASAIALTLFLGTTIWVGSRAWAYVQSIQPKEVPMAKNVPPVEQWIPNLAEREPYDPWTDQNYRRRMKTAAKDQERKEREEQKEAELLATRMQYVSDPARVSGDQYNKLPRAGD